MVMSVMVRHQISEEDYQQGELVSDTKLEFIEGEIYAMNGASKNHDRIATNMFFKLLAFMQNSQFEPFSSDVKVKVGRNFFYPDMMAVCNDRSRRPHYSESPTILVEVLSKSTRRTDEKIKRLAYQSTPGLQEHVLIEQDFFDVEVCRRNKGCLPRHYFLADEFTLDPIGISLSVEDVYRRVQNEDVLTYLQQQADMHAG